MLYIHIAEYSISFEKNEKKKTNRFLSSLLFLILVISLFECKNEKKTCLNVSIEYICIEPICFEM